MDYQNLFNEGLTFAEFVRTSGTEGESFRRRYHKARVPSDLEDRFSDGFCDHSGLYFLVMLESDCPDALENVPFLVRLAEMIRIPVRLYRRAQTPELKKHFENLGFDRIPTVLVCDGAFSRLGIWQERSRSADAIVQSIKRDREAGRDPNRQRRQLIAGYRSGRFHHEMSTEILNML